MNGDLAAFVEHHRYRVLQDALNQATASYWTRRAEVYEAARPRVGDFTGRASAADIRAQSDRLTAIATACRNRASVSLIDDQHRADVVTALREVA